MVYYLKISVNHHDKRRSLCLDSSAYAHYVFNTFDHDRNGSLSFEVGQKIFYFYFCPYFLEKKLDSYGAELQIKYITGLLLVFTMYRCLYWNRFISVVSFNQTLGCFRNTPAGSSDSYGDRRGSGWTRLSFQSCFSETDTIRESVYVSVVEWHATLCSSNGVVMSSSSGYL